ncbi:MAG: hypothetical protein OXE84_07285 [Rhodobacteraceae bacterium]|nr:hypothetical protein [Paracoccaceae bacterium]MCY4197659.1 hypothetical protein [Paracoccaceae bacterium]
MDWYKTLVIALSILALTGVVGFYGNGIHSRIDTLQTEANIDRRDFQDDMDIFQTEMQRLAERRSRIDGIVEAILIENFNNNSS